MMETLNEINERHEAVKELNKSLLELHQMFLDMAVLVEQQGVQLDNIERQVRASCPCIWLGHWRLHERGSPLACEAARNTFLAGR